MKPSKLIPLSERAYQIRDAELRWYSKVFSEVDDALEFRAKFDIAEGARKAKREMVGSLVRLAGDGWATEFMAPDDLDRLYGSILSSSRRTTRGRPRSSSKPKDEGSDATTPEFDPGA